MKSVLLAMAAILSMSGMAVAQETEPTPASSDMNNIKYMEFPSHDISSQELPLHRYKEEELTPCYLNAIPVSDLRKQGWFLGVSAVASAFAGHPLGCEDLFGRISPGLQVDFGKWIIPTVGLRLHYQGDQMIAGSLLEQKYHSLMVDEILDIAAFWHKGATSPSWSFQPFLGLGILQNTETKNHPFGLHYGCIIPVRLTDLLSMNLELSGMNTFRDFDGNGDSRKLGDQFFNASLGLTCTIGNKYRRRAVIDAIPYMEQNSRMLTELQNLQSDNRTLSTELADRNRTLAEYRKILEIRGLLDAISKPGNGKSRQTHQYPYNNYSGLNSLLARLRSKDTPAPIGDNVPLNDPDSVSSPFKAKTEASEPVFDWSEYLEDIQSGRHCVGAPILFFFRLNSTKLTDPAQLTNLKEIANVAIRYSLNIKVIGAADKATGNDSINSPLSLSRAEYIGKELEQMGIDSKDIRIEALGGIATYTPAEANRNTRVELYYQCGHETKN